MTKLILNPEYGLYERGGKAFCTSRQVAEEFGKRHADILRSIEQLTAPTSGVSEEFAERNFALSSYRSEQNKAMPQYLMTKDGFTILAMGFTGKKAMKFKESYIRRFNEMADFIKFVIAAKLEHPAFTEAIQASRELQGKDVAFHHFSNEADMINRIILGMSAKQFRELHGIAKGQSIRPYLNSKQIQSVEALQRADIGLLLASLAFEQRKQALIQFFERMKLKRIA
jgi:Rha family phage regulatory protein